MALRVTQQTAAAIVRMIAAQVRVLVGLGTLVAQVLTILIPALAPMQPETAQEPTAQRVLAQRLAVELTTKPTVTMNQDAHGKPQSH